MCLRLASSRHCLPHTLPFGPCHPIQPPAQHQKHMRRLIHRLTLYEHPQLTQVTANLLIHDMGLPAHRVRALPMRTPVEIEGCRVTLLDANHVRGACGRSLAWCSSSAAACLGRSCAGAGLCLGLGLLAPAPRPCLWATPSALHMRLAHPGPAASPPWLRLSCSALVQ